MSTTHFELIEALDEAIDAKCPASLEDGLLTLEDGTTLDLDKAKSALLDLIAANVKLIEEFTTGDCYVTCNPYRRTSVINALTIMAGLIEHPDPILCLGSIKQVIAHNAS